MEEIVDYYGRFAMLGAHGVVVADVRQSLGLAEGSHLHVKLHPVGAVFLRVDVMVELVQFGVMLVNPRENLAFVVATQIQVLQPNEVTAVLGLADDGLDIGDAGENRRDETSGLNALTATSISRRNDSSSVLMLHDTRAWGKVLIKSRSRNTRSDFVAMLTLMPLP